MRILFVAYCMMNNENGDSLIGVYKRALRLGLELDRRGHEVWIFCTGREGYRDELTHRAEERVRFLDFPLEVLFSPSLSFRRRYYRRAFRQLAPDLIVLGEVPLAGTLLESALCAVSLGIRIVVLDNAYGSDLARLFVDTHGPMLDGIVLTGPSSFHMRDAPSHYCAAPPYIEGSSTEAIHLLETLNLKRRRLITVLGYEKKAEQLAAGLMPRLHEHDCATLFLSPNPDESREHLSVLPEAVAADIRILPPPGENLLFGLLQRSNLVIGKIGFMQVSECLALGTPFLGIQYRGCFPLSILSEPVSRFVYGTSSVECDDTTLAAAIRLLHTSAEEMVGVHDGRFGGRVKAANFMERLPAAPRSETMEECAQNGYSKELLARALSARHYHAPVEIHAVRGTRLRHGDWGRIDSLAPVYAVRGRRTCAFLWGRTYYGDEPASIDYRAATSPGSRRRVLYVTDDGRQLIEEDAGEPFLPPVSF
jgi:hypothetical protein